MTRLISVGLVVRVPDEVADIHEALYQHLENILITETGIEGHICSLSDMTAEIVASIGEDLARKRGLIP
ncbi:MAG: hypothetical protein WC541_07515 [Dehalococcoidia bacterium]